MAVEADKVIVSVEAEGLDRAGQSATRYADTFERGMGRVEKSGRVLDRAIGSANQQMTAMAGRVPVVGGALGVLGVAASAATLAIGALFSAMAGSLEAGRFAQSIQDAAAAANLSTDALQELQYATRNLGGDANNVAGAMETFSERLGQAKEGARAASRLFAELGFSRAQLQSMQDMDQALRLVMERIAQIRDPNERDAVIRQLGLQSVAPLINAGVERMQELRAEAQRTGAVFDSGLLDRAAETNREFQNLAQIIDIQLKSALVDLTPILTGLLSLLAGMAGEVAHMVDDLREIEGRSTRRLSSDIGRLQAEQLADAAALARGGTAELRDNTAAGLMGINGGFNASPPSAQVDNVTAAQLRQRMATRQAEINRRIEIINGRLTTRTPGGGNRDIDLSNPSRGSTPHDPTLDQNNRTAQAIQAAQRGELSAREDLARNAEQRSALAIESLELDARQRTEDLRLQVQRGQLRQEQADQIAAAEDITRSREREAIEARHALDDERERNAQREYIGGIYDEIAQIESQRARTILERYEIERRALQHAQRRERADLEGTIEREGLSPSDAAARREALADRERAQLGDLRQSAVDDFKEGILGAFEALREGGAVGVLEYLADRFKARLLDNLAEQLANILLQAGSTKGGGSWLQTAAQIGSSLFGKRASGGPVVAGMPYIVGEQRAEVFVPSTSGRIDPRVRPAGVGGAAVINLTLNNPVVWQGEAERLMEYARQVAGKAALAGGDLGHAKTMASLRTSQRRAIS